MAKRTLTGTTLDTIVSLAKRRGFVFQSSEIYGGLSSVWDYGPVGVELKRNVKDAWWKSMVRDRDECQDCNKRYRQDQLEGEACPNCGGAFGEPRQFNLMFKTFMGPVEDDAATVYMRPETAQAMFVNFENVQTTSRKKIPFGIAQIGKSFRNEITPGNFTFRTREFEQMEMEFFCEPGTDDEWHEYWKDFSMEWFKKFGIRGEKLIMRVHEADELPHYSKASADVEYEFPWGWGELETISNRTDFDLKAHTEKSGKDLSYFDDQKKERYVPFVVEPAMGADRSALAFLLDAYDEEGEGKEMRVVLRFHPDIAPYQVAVLPLSRNEKLTPTARRVYDVVRAQFNTQYDDSQSIGRRYRRQDEIGTPLCVTVDFDTIDDEAVTIRNRDTMEQIRVSIDKLEGAIRDQLNQMRVDSHG